MFRSLIAEIVAAGFAAGAFGAALGLAAALVASRLLATRSILGIEFADAIRIPDWHWFAGVLVGLPVALALGAIRPLVRLARIAPDDALRQL